MIRAIIVLTLVDAPRTTPNLEGQGVSSFGTSLKTCPAWVSLPQARLYLSSLQMQVSCLAPLNMY
jgi:hypothetical protein